ncbi:MAG: hypothetical protein JWO46_3209 [Nocardioidaceae bacterium]|nr:hypothetical protein [Nocardioidaceae bacterium]
MLTRDDLPTEPFTLSQALDRGISRWDLEQAVHARLLHRLLRGVYVRTDVRDTIALRCRAASLVLSRHTVVRDRTAAWLHGIDVFDYHETEILPPLETSVLRWHEPTRRADHVGGTRDLAPRDIQQVHGLSVTTPMRTALDLGCALPPRHGLAMLDAFARHYGFARSQLEREALRYRRRRGVVQLRRLLSMVDARAESPAESWTRYCMLDAGLPAPELQWWVDVGGVPTYRLDLAYPRHRVAVEYDGEEFHTSPDARRRDEERRAWLRAHGWIVIVVRRDGFGPRAVEAWTGEVRAALASRTWRAS